jgi:hypothetical protein
VLHDGGRVVPDLLKVDLMLNELIQAPTYDEAWYHPVRQAKEKRSDLVAHTSSLGQI